MEERKNSNRDTVEWLSALLKGTLTIAMVLSDDDNTDTRPSRIGREKLDRRENRTPTIDIDYVHRNDLLSAMYNAGVSEIGESKHMDEDTFFFISENSDIFGMSFLRFKNKHHAGVAHVRKLNLFNTYCVDIYSLAGNKLVSVKIDPSNEDEIQWLSRSLTTAFEKSCESRGYPMQKPTIDR